MALQIGIELVMEVKKHQLLRSSNVEIFVETKYLCINEMILIADSTKD